MSAESETEIPSFPEVEEILADGDRNRDADRQGDRDAVNEGSSDLEAVKGKSSATEPGAENSNAILDTGASSLKCFEIFIPRYNRALGLTGGGADLDMAEIRRLYDEQRDIPFGKFKAGAAEFSAVKDALSESSADVSGGLRPTLSAWEGAAADQARDYQSGYEKQTDVVEGAFGDAAQAMLEAIATVSQHCQGKADWVQRYYFDRIFETVTAEDLDRMMRIVELGKHASQNDFIHCARLIGGEAEAAVNDESCDLNEETIRKVQEEARQWLADPFCAWFGEHVANFKLMCQNTRTAVDGTWSALATLLNELPEDPYAAESHQPSGNGRGGVQGTGPVGGATGGGGMPGGGMPVGAGTAPAGIELPKPGSEALYPIDPETGDAVKDAGADQGPRDTPDLDGEKVYRPGPDGKIVIEDDELTSTAERPEGPAGPTVVTFDDGTGEPTSYTIGDKGGSGGGSGGDNSGSGSGGATTPQFFGGAADAIGGSLGGGGFPADIGAAAGGVGLGDTSSLDAGQQIGSGDPVPPGSSAGLASIAGPSHRQVPGDASAVASGGAPMGGMMGGMGAGGGGGDEQRHSRSYRIDGGLFDTEESVVSGVVERISGVLGDGE